MQFGITINHQNLFKIQFEITINHQKKRFKMQFEITINHQKPIQNAI